MIVPLAVRVVRVVVAKREQLGAVHSIVGCKTRLVVVSRVNVVNIVNINSIRVSPPASLAEAPAEEKLQYR